MSTLKINYTEPTDRPIESVGWVFEEEQFEARVDCDGDLCISGGCHCLYVRKPDALAWVRAVLKMVEQAQGGGYDA